MTKTKQSKTVTPSKVRASSSLKQAQESHSPGMSPADVARIIRDRKALIE